MKEQGIPSHRLERKVTSFEELRAAIDAIDAARDGYPYETDGAVVKVDDYRQEEILGFTSKFPKWAIAYKFAAEQARTIVREVQVQVGRTRRAHAGRGARSRRARRDDRVARVAPQRGLHRPARRADRRRGLHPKGGGDHPPSDGGGPDRARSAPRAKRRARPFRDADPLPCVRDGGRVAPARRGRSRRGERGDRALPEPRLPRASKGADLLFRAPLRDGRRSPRRRPRGPARGQGDRPRRGGPLRAHARGGRRARADGGQEREERGRRDRRFARADARQAPVWARNSADRAGRGQAARGSGRLPETDAGVDAGGAPRARGRHSRFRPEDGGERGALLPGRGAAAAPGEAARARGRAARAAARGGGDDGAAGREIGLRDGRSVAEAGGHSRRAEGGGGADRRRGEEGHDVPRRGGEDGESEAGSGEEVRDEGDYGGEMEELLREGAGGDGGEKAEEARATTDAP